MNRATLTAGLALMDLCWAYPWCVLLGVWTDASRTTGLLSPVRCVDARSPARATLTFKSVIPWVGVDRSTRRTLTSALP